MGEVRDFTENINQDVRQHHKIIRAPWQVQQE
jgi:hypothetical protein